jgi:ribosomal subunit interface protein
MRVQVAGRHMDVGEALRSRITDELTQGVSKYFSRATDAIVTAEKVAVGYKMNCVVHLSSGITLEAEGAANDPHAAFDDALTKIEKRVRRYKRRLKNHHNMNKSPLPAETAAAYVLAPLPTENGEDEEPDEAEVHTNGDAPLVIAETTASVRTMPVSMAVMQLELSDAPALLFRNAGHGGLNLVYRRPDGNIGWVDPGRNATLDHSGAAPTAR